MKNFRTICLYLGFCFCVLINKLSSEKSNFEHWDVKSDTGFVWNDDIAQILIIYLDLSIC